MPRVSNARFLALFALALFMFGLSAAGQGASAHGAEALQGTRGIRWADVVACRSQERDAARSAALQALDAVCRAQNESLAAQGIQACAPGQCFERLVHDDGKSTLPVELGLDLDPVDGFVALKVVFPLGLPRRGTAGWRATCVPVLSLAARKHWLGDATRFFEEALSSLDACPSNHP